MLLEILITLSIIKFPFLNAFVLNQLQTCLVIYDNLNWLPIQCYCKNFKLSIWKTVKGFLFPKLQKICCGKMSFHEIAGYDFAF